jgi:hypothetical protein
MFIVPNGRDAFTPEGGLANSEACARLEKLVQGYLGFAKSLASPT